MNKSILILLFICTVLSSCALDTFEEKLVGTWVMVDVQCVTFSPPTIEKLYIDNFTFPTIRLEVSRLIFSDYQVDGCRYEFRRFGYFK